MPSFAELKQKASKATDSSISAVKNTKDRHTSVAMKNTNWNPYDRSTPPPPKPSAWAKPAKPEAPPVPPPTRRGTSSTSGSSPTPTPSPKPTPFGRPAIKSPNLPGRGAGSGPPVINRSTRPDQPSPPPPPSLPTRAPSLTSRAPSLPSRAPSLPSRTPSYQREPQPEIEEEEEEPQPEIDWTNLSLEDKEVFFSWLDEFFERSYGIVAPNI
ncbi:hypothetical protein BT96DRAFT_975048 [Gymnopus androsaceus JB14]|uniref:Uncharacterized protein n=1 Tax=Gymnopus androsaceus JB14 TaxID=1447944 RepID=A0A6A4HSA7_9AGAR|nr:hypothetical protein BT96DRAFT_975048 [Gymnopus androsaceus JB14]